jgi:acyl carrier protein
MTAPTITDRLVTFIQGLVGEDSGIRVDEQTPLLELGILDSLKTAMLLNYAHNALNAWVPIEKLTPSTFRDARSLAAVIEENLPVPADGGRHDT